MAPTDPLTLRLVFRVTRFTIDTGGTSHGQGFFPLGPPEVMAGVERVMVPNSEQIQNFLSPMKQ